MNINDSYIISDKDEEAVKVVHPKNGKNFKLNELRPIVGGHIEIAESKLPGLIIVLDEEGKLKKKPINKLATAMYKYGKDDPICGQVLICKTLNII